MNNNQVTYYSIKGFAVHLDELSHSLKKLIVEKYHEEPFNNELKALYEAMASRICWFREEVLSFDEQNEQSEESRKNSPTREGEFSPCLLCPELLRTEGRPPSDAGTIVPDGWATPYTPSHEFEQDYFKPFAEFHDDSINIINFLNGEENEWIYVCGGVNIKGKSAKEVEDHFKLENQGQCWECNVHKELLEWASE